MPGAGGIVSAAMGGERVVDGAVDRVVRRVLTS